MNFMKFVTDIFVKNAEEKLAEKEADKIIDFEPGRLKSKELVKNYEIHDEKTKEMLKKIRRIQTRLPSDKA
jgi:uncharacterized membrane protein